MRLTRTPGTAWPWTVYLDGERVPHPHSLDTEAGWVECYADGSAATWGGERARRHGRVEAVHEDGRVMR